MARVSSFRAMETTHVMCRALQHSWSIDRTSVQREGTRQVFVLELQCTVCPTVRVDRIDSTGQLVGRTYKHPDGYLVEDRASWGAGSTFKNNVRQELVRRLKRGEV